MRTEQPDYSLLLPVKHRGLIGLKSPAIAERLLSKTTNLLFGDYAFRSVDLMPNIKVASAARKYGGVKFQLREKTLSTLVFYVIGLTPSVNKHHCWHRVVKGFTV